MIRVVLFVFFLLCTLLSPLLAQNGSFAIVSDTHVGFNGDGAWAAFVKAMDEQKVDLVIHVGDAIDRPGSTSQWTKFLNVLGTRTIHLAPGNHDIKDKASLGVYSKFFSAPYHSFSDKDTLFILLNTELPGEVAEIKGEQLVWLEKELNRSFRYKFVFLHEPPFPFVPQHGLDQHVAARDKLHRLFAAHGVSLVVSGHDHVHFRILKEKVLYVITGGTGGERPFFSRPQYITATRTNGGYSFVAKDMDGNIIDKFSVSP